MAGYPISLPQAMQDRIAADEAREARELAARDAERADRYDTLARMAEHHENMVQYQTGHSSAEWREAASNAAVAREARNYQAEWGSATRAAILVGGQELKPREQAYGPVTMRPDSIQAQLNRAREISADPFMARMVAAYDDRRRSAESGVRGISRSEVPPEIQCLDCIADGNVTVDEYLALHHGDDPLPERRVPDYAPQRSQRAGSGTGWPQAVISR